MRIEGGELVASNNLSDLRDVAAARTSLSLDRAPITPTFIAFDDFETGAGSLSGRTPQIGTGNWSTSGAGNNAVVGSGAITAAGNTYCFLSMASTPVEIGGEFEILTTNQAVTISCLLNSASLTDMLHMSFGSAGGGGSSFSCLHWKTGVGSSLQMTGQAVGVAPTLAINTRYVARLIIEAPFCDAIIEDASGNTIATARCYEPNIASIIGPNAFWQLNGGVNKWHKVWAYGAQPGVNTSSAAKFPQGLDGTPIGRSKPASAAFLAATIGKTGDNTTNTPSGSSILTARHSSAAEAPVVTAKGTHGLLVVKTDSNGYGAEIQVNNGAGGSSSIGLDGSYLHTLKSNSAVWLTKPWTQSTPPYFSTGIGISGSAGPTWTSGTGSPEGVVTAPVGSLYSNTSGGASTTLYVKTSGTGNTGWTAK